ncbi:MAG: YjbF family lipoprotein [Paracoccaceae bacterium]
MTRQASKLARAGLLVSGLALLASCTSDGSSAAERLGPLAEEVIFGKQDPEPPQVLTRAELAQVPFATLAISTPGGPRSYVAAVANNDGFVAYQDQSRRSIIMEGGMLVATHGLGYDLAAIKHQPDDPVALQTPVSQWPGVVVRNYQFTRTGTTDYQVTVSCSFQKTARERIEIVELFFDVQRIDETCGNGKRSFTNTYWVAVDTGFIWKSVQWIGPRQPDPFVLEVIRPIG